MARSAAETLPLGRNHLRGGFTSPPGRRAPYGRREGPETVDGAIRWYRVALRSRFRLAVGLWIGGRGGASQSKSRDRRQSDVSLHVGPSCRGAAVSDDGWGRRGLCYVWAFRGLLVRATGLTEGYRTNSILHVERRRLRVGMEVGVLPASLARTPRPRPAMVLELIDSLEYRCNRAKVQFEDTGVVVSLPLRRLMALSDEPAAASNRPGR